MHTKSDIAIHQVQIYKRAKKPQKQYTVKDKTAVYVTRALTNLWLYNDPFTK